MKLNKMIKNAISGGAVDNNKVAIAVVAGLAVGAALAVLFAPAKGDDIRRSIDDQRRGLGGKINDTFASLKRRILNEDEVLTQQMEAPKVAHHHTQAKKPKSDIKELIHETHRPHTEQGL